jgi:hypothetical protein
VPPTGPGPPRAPRVTPYGDPVEIVTEPIPAQSPFIHRRKDRGGGSRPGIPRFDPDRAATGFRLPDARVAAPEHPRDPLAARRGPCGAVSGRTRARTASVRLFLGDSPGSYSSDAWGVAPGFDNCIVASAVHREYQGVTESLDDLDVMAPGPLLPPAAATPCSPAAARPPAPSGHLPDSPAAKPAAPTKTGLPQRRTVGTSTTSAEIRAN